MTDEEFAEEYIRTDGTNGEKVWEKIHKEFPNCIVVKSAKSKKRLSELFFEYTRVVFLDGLTEGRKENEELKEKISVLLSCANCSENKGGYICEREYNDKCLAQKIEYIKELKEEIAELKRDKESLKLIIDKAKEQIEQLSNDNHVLKTAFITQQNKIEKMKADILELKNTFNYFPINSAIDEILEKWESKN